MKYKILLHQETVLANTLDDLNNSQRQEMAELFLKLFPAYLMNEEVEYILQRSFEDPAAPFSWDDMANYHSTGYCKLLDRDITESKRELLFDFYTYLVDKAENVFSQKLNHTGKRLAKFYRKMCHLKAIAGELEYLDCEENQPEVKWFFCPELCYHLAKRGEIVLDEKYWGRQCYGQSIILDPVVQDIAFELSKRKIK